VLEGGAGTGDSGVGEPPLAQSYRVDGCTLSGNGQFGIWSSSGGSSRQLEVSWGRNTLAGNALGEAGGRGQLLGWQRGVDFQAGDECVVWSEAQGIWLPGFVRSLLPDGQLSISSEPLAESSGFQGDSSAEPRDVGGAEPKGDIGADTKDSGALEAPAVSTAVGPGQEDVWQLTHLYSKHALVTQLLRSGAMSIGRHHSCDIVCVDPRISRRHCIIHAVQGAQTMAAERCGHGNSI